MTAAVARVTKMQPRRRKLRFEVHHGSRIIPEAEQDNVLLRASATLRANREREEQVRALARRPTGEDAANVRFAMRAIEHRIVRGLFVLEISLPREGVPMDRQHGLEYMREREDHYAAGQWQQQAPRPAVPSPKEISAANEAVRWIDSLSEEDARFVRVAAQSKRGERSARIKWERVFNRLPHLMGTSLRTLQDRYDRALRRIVAELSVSYLEREGR